MERGSREVGRSRKLGCQNGEPHLTPLSHSQSHASEGIRRPWLSSVPTFTSSSSPSFPARSQLTLSPFCLYLGLMSRAASISRVCSPEGGPTMWTNRPPCSSPTPGPRLLIHTIVPTKETFPCPAQNWPGGQGTAGPLRGSVLLPKDWQQWGILPTPTMTIVLGLQP